MRLSSREGWIMSFSTDTKNELTHVEPDKKCCMLAEIAGFLRMCGSIQLAGGGRMDIKLSTENPAIARLFIKLIKSYFGAKVDLSIGEAHVLKRGHSYELTITSDMNAEQILRETGILRVKEGSNYISDGIYADLIRKRCCRKACLRGIFLASGTITDPGKGYHVELVCASEYMAGDVKKLVNSFGLRSKISRRKSQYIVYIKESEQIIDFLNILGAHGQLLQYENVRIVREMRNKANRINNCESANVDKTVNTAGRQIDNIRLIEQTRGLSSLPEKLMGTARLRLENPEATLAELAEMTDPPMKKSGINHRLKKLDEIAGRIRTGGGKK